MDELIDILTKDGKPTGKTALKSEIHSKGFYHNTVHIWFYNSDGKILLAQRSALKTIHPLLWDVSVAGHVDAGESLKTAAKREIREEINFKVKKKDLHKIGVFECFQSYDNGIVDNEFHHTYISDYNKTRGALKLAKDEVEDVIFVTSDRFLDILDNIGKDNYFVSSNKTYYQKVFDAILKQVS